MRNEKENKYNISSIFWFLWKAKLLKMFTNATSSETPLEKLLKMFTNATYSETPLELSKTFAKTL